MPSTHRIVLISLASSRNLLPQTNISWCYRYSPPYLIHFHYINFTIQRRVLKCFKVFYPNHTIQLCDKIQFSGLSLHIFYGNWSSDILSMEKRYHIYPLLIHWEHKGKWGIIKRRRWFLFEVELKESYLLWGLISYCGMENKQGFLYPQRFEYLNYLKDAGSW